MGSFLKYSKANQIYPYIKALLIVGFILALIGIAHLTPLAKYMEFSYIIQKVRNVPENWVSFLSLQLLFVAGSWFLFPLTASSIIALAIFDFWIAFGCALSGVFLSSSFTYLIGRYGLNISDSNRYKKHIDIVREEINEYGYWAIAALRLAPQPPFVATSLIAGAIKVNYLKYLFATYLGLTPILILTFSLGRAAFYVMDDPLTLLLFLVVSLGIIIPFYIMIKKRVRARLRSKT